MLARLTAAVLAAVACAWFVLGGVQSHDLTAATNLATAATVSSAQAAHARSLLSVAGTLNPDREVTLVRADLLLRTGQAGQAQRLTESVTRAEPRNILAWYELATEAGGSAPVLESALKHIRELQPPKPHATS
jgi:predicted Zn-dependent protease